MSYANLNRYHNTQLPISVTTVTVAASGGDYTSVKSALAAIGTPTYRNQVRIYVRNGTYQEIQMGGKFWVTIEGESVSGAIINIDGARTDVDPVSGQRYVDMADGDKHGWLIAHSMTFRNLTLLSNNTKYIFHIDTTGSCFTVDVDNCILAHADSYPVGIGARDRGRIYIHSSTIQKTGANQAFGNIGSAGVYWHDTYPQTTENGGLEIVDCDFVNCGMAVIQEFGGTIQDTIKLDGCTTDDEKSLFYTVSSASYGGAAAEVPYTVSVYLSGMQTIPAVTYNADRPNGSNYVYIT